MWFGTALGVDWSRSRNPRTNVGREGGAAEMTSGTRAPLRPGPRTGPLLSSSTTVLNDGQPTLTAISWMPLEPSGKGATRTAVWTSPSLLVARLATKCWPGSASHS